jgi:adenylate cyclase
MEFAKICRACVSQGAKPPIRLGGLVSLPFKVAGIRRSKMNPNICTLCEGHFTNNTDEKKHRVVNATILFADIRGYTTLSEKADSAALANALSIFYEHSARVVWQYEGVVNKFIGDAMLAIFNFPIFRDDHITQAVMSGIALQAMNREIRKEIEDRLGFPNAIRFGIGIHTGEVTIGQIGSLGQDLTAIGNVVNIASRLQGVAKGGEVLVTEDVYKAVRSLYPEAPCEEHTLKGLEKPIKAYSLR